MPSKETHPRFHLFYGWYIVASSFAILFFIAGARYSFGVMFKPMIAEFGWNRGSISLAFFINTTLWALSLIIVGRFYDRFGPKWVIIISTIFLSTGYTLMSVIHHLWQFYLFYGILAAIGMSGPSILLIAAIISKWFEKWRGLTISLALSGNCLGQFALVPLFTLFALRFGWRTSYLFIGLVILVVNILLALLVIKGDPENLGRRPFGYQEIGKTEVKMRQEPPINHREDLSLREAMHTPSFWFFLIAMFICGSGDFLVTVHLIPFVTDQGISPSTAGNMLAWFGLMSLAGILIAGTASDLIGNKIPIALMFLLRFALFLLILKYKNLTSFYIFALAFGFTYLITGPLITTLLGRLYGFSHIGLISGFVTTIHHFGGGFWAYMGGLIFDQTGGYQFIFILSAILALIAFFCCILISERRHVYKINRLNLNL
jgi:MFS family permease